MQRLLANQICRVKVLVLPWALISITYPWIPWIGIELTFIGDFGKCNVCLIFYLFFFFIWETTALYNFALHERLKQTSCTFSKHLFRDLLLCVIVYWVNRFRRRILILCLRVGRYTRTFYSWFCKSLQIPKKNSCYLYRNNSKLSTCGIPD